MLAACTTAAATAACFPKVTGAACDKDDNCPSGQYCTSERVCEPKCYDAAGNAVDTSADPQNCGRCGSACAQPLNAGARCLFGACGRGPCQTAFFDIDGPSTFGCESTCVGRDCTDPSGNKVTLSHDPLPETNGARVALVSGGSFGAGMQTSATHTNFLLVGSSTPPGVGGAVEAKSAAHRHRFGFAALKR